MRRSRPNSPGAGRTRVRPHTSTPSSSSASTGASGGAQPLLLEEKAHQYHGTNRGGLTPDAYRQAVEELKALGLVETSTNLAHPTGYARTTVSAEIFVQVAGQVLSGVNIGRELAQVLTVFRRAGDGPIGAADFEALGIPLPRTQRFLGYLMMRDIIKLRPPAASVDRLQFFYATLTARGRRVLRGDDPLPLT